MPGSAHSLDKHTLRTESNKTQYNSTQKLVTRALRPGRTFDLVPLQARFLLPALGFHCIVLITV